MARFKWYRRLTAGNRYLTRMWTDEGRVCIFYWSRKFHGYKGGSLCTISEENY